MTDQAAPTNALAELKPDQYNLMTYQTRFQQDNPFFALQLSIIHVKPDTGAGEVFSVGNRRDDGGRYIPIFALSGSTIERMGAAAGITWVDSRPVIARPELVMWQATGQMHLPNGQIMQMTATKELDLTVIEDEIRQDKLDSAARSKEPKPEGWVEQQVRAAMIQKRKNKMALAETGAKLRCIRHLLGIKSGYTQAELSKPFVIPSFVFRPDYNDPEIKNAMIRMGLQSMAALPFGKPEVALSEHLGPETEDERVYDVFARAVDKETGEVTETAETGDAPSEPTKQPESSPTANPSTSEPDKSARQRAPRKPRGETAPAAPEGDKPTYTKPAGGTQPDVRMPETPAPAPTVDKHTDQPAPDPGPVTTGLPTGQIPARLVPDATSTLPGGQVYAGATDLTGAPLNPPAHTAPAPLAPAQTVCGDCGKPITNQSLIRNTTVKYGKPLCAKCLGERERAAGN